MVAAASRTEAEKRALSYLRAFEGLVPERWPDLCSHEQTGQLIGAHGFRKVSDAIEFVVAEVCRSWPDDELVQAMILNDLNIGIEYWPERWRGHLVRPDLDTHMGERRQQLERSAAALDLLDQGEEVLLVRGRMRFVEPELIRLLSPATHGMVSPTYNALIPEWARAIPGVVNSNEDELEFELARAVMAGVVSRYLRRPGRVGEISIVGLTCEMLVGPVLDAISDALDVGDRYDASTGIKVLIHDRRGLPATAEAKAHRLGVERTLNSIRSFESVRRPEMSAAGISLELRFTKSRPAYRCVLVGDEAAFRLPLLDNEAGVRIDTPVAFFHSIPQADQVREIAAYCRGLS